MTSRRNGSKRATKQLPQLHRKAVNSLELPPTGDSNYRVPISASSQTLVDLRNAEGMRGTLWNVRRILDSYFGVTEE